MYTTKRTADLKEVEEKFSQNQRRDIKLSIVNFIENMQELTSVPEQIDNDSSFAAVTSDKKPILRRPFLQVVLASFSFILLFSLITMMCAKQLEQRQKQSAAQYLQAKQISAIGVQKESQGLPVRLIIPAINVNAGIQHVGVTPKGEMEAPSNAVDVGWFDFGPRPGERGSAVIAGHFNGKNGETGVFTNLHKLKKGDKLYIEDSYGKSITFVVRQSRTYNPGYAEEVFSLNDKAHLNLITCDGVWDGAKKNYTKRLVVFADITH